MGKFGAMEGREKKRGKEGVKGGKGGKKGRRFREIFRLWGKFWDLENSGSFFLLMLHPEIGLVVAVGALGEPIMVILGYF